MKIQHHQLNSMLEKELASVYLISGDEPLLCLEAVSAISNKAKQLGFSEKKHFVLEQDKDADAFMTEATTGSLFASKREIGLQLLSGKVSIKVAKKLRALVELVDKDRTLILSAPKLDKATTSSAWVKAIEKIGVWITIYPLKDNEYTAWIHNRLNACGTDIKSDALTIIAEMNSGNLLTANQQINRLSILFPNQTITTERLLESSMDNSKYDIFQLIDFALLAQVEELLHSFQRITQEGLTQSVLLWHINYQLRQLLELSEARDKRTNLRMAMNNMRIWTQRQTVYLQTLTRLNTAIIIYLLRLCSKIDQQIKGGRKSVDINESLRSLILLIAGKKTPALFDLLIEEQGNFYNHLP